MLVDIGVNLTSRQFEADRADVVERATQAGILQMVVTGTSVANSQAALDLTERWPDLLRATAGIHPHDAKTFDDGSIDALRVLAQQPTVVAIGECGLDHNRDFSPRADQARCFQAQLALAVELQLPVFMHQRDGHDAFMAILSPACDQLTRGVVHCFTGSKDELFAYLDHNLYIGVTGWICDERRGEELRSLVRDIPLDRILVETDAPYLLPRNLVPRPKSRRNEPCHLPHIVKTIADCMGVEADLVARRSTENAQRFFALNQTPPPVLG